MADDYPERNHRFSHIQQIFSQFSPSKPHLALGKSWEFGKNPQKLPPPIPPN
jgi:hypothetical protein